MLADYLEGRLSPKDRTDMERHLAECPTCLEELIVTSNIVRGGEYSELESVPIKVTQEAMRLLKRESPPASCISLLEKSRKSIRGIYNRLSVYLKTAFLGQWELAPIRGSRRVVSEDLIHIRKTFKEIETEIEIEKTGERRAYIRVSLSPRVSKGKGVRATLIRGEREVSSLPLTENPAVFEEIPFGHYRLNFSRNGVNLGTYLFEIKES